MIGCSWRVTIGKACAGPWSSFLHALCAGDDVRVYAQEEHRRSRMISFIICRLKRYVTVLRVSAKKWKFSVGRHPHNVAPNTLIIFPILDDRLFCGLAGILAVKGEGVPGYRFSLDELFERWNEVSERGLKITRKQTLSMEQYLGGRQPLESLARQIDFLKEDVSFQTLFEVDDHRRRLAVLSGAMSDFIAHEEDLIDEAADTIATVQIEQATNLLTMLKDCAWTLERDILAAFPRIEGLRGNIDPQRSTENSVRQYRKIDLLLNTLDRLEVRGRDSAGIQLALTFRDREAREGVLQDIHDQGLFDDFAKRSMPGDLVDESLFVTGEGTVHSPTCMIFTYKTASVNGELGENTRYLRQKLQRDSILHLALSRATMQEMYMVHTRWASVGSITIENCHPVNNFIPGDHGSIQPGRYEINTWKDYPYYGKGDWTISAALNGDIDNYHDLRAVLEQEGEASIDHRVTTDTKIIPLRIEYYLFRGYNLSEAFRRAVNDFEGSQAIAMQSNLEPGKVFLALRGSGQSLYVGLCDDQFLYSSEVYGIVELTPDFIKIDGEVERVKGDPTTRGQIFILNSEKSRVAGIEAMCYDGCPLGIDESFVQRAEITTRDIDRSDYPHYLLKEIMEAPASVRKTLRGKYRIGGTIMESPPFLSTWVMIWFRRSYGKHWTEEKSGISM